MQRAVSPIVAVVIWGVFTSGASAQIEESADGPLEGFGTRPTAAAVSRDGKLLAVGSLDGEVAPTRAVVRLYSFAEKKIVATLQGHKDDVVVVFVAFPEKQGILVSVDDSGKVLVWDLAAKKIGKEFQAVRLERDNVALVLGGEQLAWSGKRSMTVELLHLSTGKQRELVGHHDEVLCLAGSPDGKVLASASHDGAIILWDVDRAKKLRTLKEHNDAVYRLCFSADGNTLASAGFVKRRDGDQGLHCELKLWDPHKGVDHTTIRPLEPLIYAIALSPTARTVIACEKPNSSGSQISVWDAESGKKALTRDREYSPWLCVMPDGKRLLTAGFGDGKVAVWNVKESASGKR